MPRLVAMTLLSILMLPSAGLLYIVIVVVGMEWFGRWGPETGVWLVADVALFGFAALWWVAVWQRSVQWTPEVVGRTVIAVPVAMLLGALLGVLVSLPLEWDDWGFGVFVGGKVATLSWLVAVTVLWRRRAVPAGPDGPTVVCVKCGYQLRGLREARCPECGQHYTLDELFAAQPAIEPRDGSDRELAR